MKNTKILLYGGKSTAFTVYEMLKDENKKLNSFSIKSKHSIIDKSVKHGHGFLALPNSVVDKNIKEEAYYASKII